MYLLKENAKPVSHSKKRRKISLLELPGAPINPNVVPQQNFNDMVVDDGLEDDSSAVKWPGKRGGRKNKEL